LGWMRDVFERGLDTPPNRAAGLVLLLASRRGDALTGRFLAVEHNIEQLFAEAERVVREDLNVLRPRTPGTP